jgi:calcineurin-like phosphoesterase family protein
MKNEFITKIENPDRTFLVSDSHYNHTNILKYCERPFDTVEEMNQTLIDNWNSVVGKEDHIYHLGDFSFRGIDALNPLLEDGVLNGHIHLILGNHDLRRILKPGVRIERFDEIALEKVLEVDGWTVFLNHFPFMDFSNDFDHNVCQFFGHIHSRPFDPGTITEEKRKMLKWNQYDVGVDNNDYRPISLTNAMNIIKNKRDVLSDNNENKPSD